MKPENRCVLGVVGACIAGLCATQSWVGTQLKKTMFASNVMRVLVVLLSCLLHQSVWAMEHYTEVLKDGKGNSIKGALVYVYNAGTTTPATIYSDNGMTPKANPFLTLSTVEHAGSLDFYADNGAYDLVFVKDDYEFDPLLTRRITLFDHTTGLVIPYGPTFPLSPAVNSLFILTSDSGALCDENSGSVVTLCRWDGGAWAVFGGGGGGGVTGWPSVLSALAVTSEAAGQSISIRGQGAQATSGADLFQSSTGTFEWVCVVGDVRNACDYVRELSSGFAFEIQNNSGTPIFTLENDTGAITNMTVDAEGSGNVLTRPFYWDIDLCAINPADSSMSHVWNKDPLSTAPTLTAKAGTNRSTCVATFPDSDGDYGVAITRRLPNGFTGNFDAEIWWDTTGTGNAVFQVATKCYASNAADDASYNSATSVAVGAGTSGRPNAASNPNITKTGCAAGNLIRIRFFRNRGGSDTLNAALNVEKVVFIGRTTK